MPSRSTFCTRRTEDVVARARADPSAEALRLGRKRVPGEIWEELPMNSLGCTLISETGERHHFTSFRKASEFLNRSRGYISQCIQHRVPLTHNDTHEHYDIECDEMDKTTIAHVRKRSQPCCECKNAVGGCSWSRRFEPVKGWIAIPTVINHGGILDGSYMILHCPDFERG